MKTIELTCIRCPMGCQIKVETEGDEIISVTGNTCKRGEVYARTEVSDPRRTVTSTVRVEGGVLPVVSVKTKTDIPKAKIDECMEEINKITVKAPVRIGDVVLSDVAGTGADVVVTKDMPAAK